MTRPDIRNCVGARPVPFAFRNATGRELFLKGLDTFDLMAHFHITEVEALKLISVGRSEALFLPDPYEFHQPVRLSA